MATIQLLSFTGLQYYQILLQGKQRCAIDSFIFASVSMTMLMVGVIWSATYRVELKFGFHLSSPWSVALFTLDAAVVWRLMTAGQMPAI